MQIVVPSLIVLVGPSGSGKTTWAEGRFAAGEIVSSDALRAAVGLGEHDQRASSDAFAVLNDIIERRLARNLTTVVDTLGLNESNRRRWIAAADAAGMSAHAIAFATDAQTCRARNKRRARPVPAKVLTGQIDQFTETLPRLGEEGFESVAIAGDDVRFVNRAMAGTDAAAERQRADPARLDFGLQVATFNFTGAPEETGRRLAEIAQSAESIGFTSLWVMDHFIQIPQVGPEWWDMPEAYVTLSYLAGSTHRIRLGTMVTGATYRNPALLGKMIATLDVLSGGRAMAGLGAGWFERETVAYGWEVPTTSERLDRLEDLLELLPLLWGPGAPAFQGRTCSVPEAVCYPRPLQDRIPILVGGGGEKRTLRLVAKHADATNLMGDPDTVAHKVQVLRGHCADVERDPDEIAVTHLSPVLLGGDRADLERQLEAVTPPNRSAAAVGAAFNAGTVEDQIGRYRRLHEVGVTTAIVSPVGLSAAEDLDRYIPLIDAFAAG